MKSTMNLIKECLEDAKNFKENMSIFESKVAKNDFEEIRLCIDSFEFLIKKGGVMAFREAQTEMDRAMVVLKKYL